MASESVRAFNQGAQGVSFSAADAVPANSFASNSTVWDRVSRWVAEHKVVVYTVAGVTVVAGAGFYYVSRSNQTPKADDAASIQRKSKKERRKAKKDAEEAVQTTEPEIKGMRQWLLSLHDS